MFTQKRKLHSVHMLQSGREFAGEIEVGRTKYRFVFSPSRFSTAGGAPMLAGRVRVKAPGGRERILEKVEARVLAQQGSILSAPPRPARLDASLRAPFSPQDPSKPKTDATGDMSIAAVVYFRLSPMEGAALGLPLDLSAVQINARLYPASETERELHWLYSAVVATHAATPGDQDAMNRLGDAINRIMVE
ncbi:MAG: hypothetical protein ACKVX9_16905 [Blastocatellia bacterium]